MNRQRGCDGLRCLAGASAGVLTRRRLLGVSAAVMAPLQLAGTRNPLLAALSQLPLGRPGLLHAGLHGLNRQNALCRNASLFGEAAHNETTGRHPFRTLDPVDAEENAT